ncbi:MAG: GNAT family N-acetyltransferase [Clostridiales bacterium]|nr:GNAT family N-acetyltransferase [Clostridiales bacterium]
MFKLNRIFEGFPTISTTKFDMRLIRPSDRSELLSIYSDEESVKYQAMHLMENETKANQMIEMISNGYECKYFARWGITDKETDKLVGIVSIHHIDYKNNSSQIGYILNKAYWNKSIMTHIVSDTIDYLFKEVELKRLIAEIHPENKASIRLSEKLGFKKEGVSVDSIFNPSTNKYENRIIMSLVNSI